MVGKKFGPPWTLYTRAPNIDRNDARIFTFVYLRSINWSNILVTLSYMSGVVPGPPAQMEEPVAFSTKITTAVADDNKCFSIIVIMASRPFRITNTTTALASTQTFYMISVKHTKGSYSRSGPRRVRLRTVSPIALFEKLIQTSLSLPWVTSLRSWTISWNPFLICDIDSPK